MKTKHDIGLRIIAALGSLTKRSTGPLLICLLGLSSCVSLNSVSVTQIPKQRKNQVYAEVDKFVILGFNFDNDFVEGIKDKLKNQCRGGKITGILTKDERVNYFFFFFWKMRISARGYCVK